MGLFKTKCRFFSSTSAVIDDVIARGDDGTAGHVLMLIAELWQRNNLLSNQKHVQPRQMCHTSYLKMQ